MVLNSLNRGTKGIRKNLKRKFILEFFFLCLFYFGRQVFTVTNLKP